MSAMKTPSHTPPGLETQAIDLAIHRLWPPDYASWRAHLKRLDPQSRRQRFFGAVSDAFLDSYVDRAHGDGALVYGAFVEGVMRAASELRLVRRAWPMEAEAALSVERDWQDEGIGTALLGRAITAARNRGIVKIAMICQRENARMRHLAEKYEADLTFEEGGVTGLVVQPWPDPLSLLEESMREAQGLLTAVFRWPAQPPQTSLTR
jgi:GNAT superfamily N-acetyltransferase